ncbi:MAG: serine protease [Candidatus Aminicenantes bacterium]|jgi:hypothetical protein
MTYQRESQVAQVEYTVEELERELIARGAQIPGEEMFKFKDQEGTPERKAIMEQVKEFYKNNARPFLNKQLNHISTPKLINMLTIKARQITKSIGINYVKGIWYCDDRKDYYEITDEPIRENANCTAIICKKGNLIDEKNGFSTLKIKNYGETFNLCDSEPFRDQPIAAGRLCTGFLVQEDIIATAGHCVNDKNVKDLCFVFGFKMADDSTPVIQVPNENIYKGVEIIRSAFDRRFIGKDWALVQLDRSVVRQNVATLSRKDISLNQNIYVMGYPLGLPLKYAPGACVCDIHESHFAAQLDVYSGNSGSPVFDKDRHEVIGMVVRAYSRDFRWTGQGWVSVIYPNREISSPIPQCTRGSQLPIVV